MCMMVSVCNVFICLKMKAFCRWRCDLNEPFLNKQAAPSLLTTTTGLLLTESIKQHTVGPCCPSMILGKHGLTDIKWCKANLGIVRRNKTDHGNIFHLCGAPLLISRPVLKRWLGQQSLCTKGFASVVCPAECRWVCVYVHSEQLWGQLQFSTLNGIQTKGRISVVRLPRTSDRSGQDKAKASPALWASHLHRHTS